MVSSIVTRKLNSSDGEMFVTLSGESVVSGKPMSLSFDARTVPASRFDKLRSGDFIEFNSYTEVMPNIGGYSKISASERSWSNSNALPVRTCIFQIIFVHGLPYQ